MKKPLMFILALIIVAATAIGVYLAANHFKTKTSDISPSNAMEMSLSGSSNATNTPTGNNVVIQNFAFGPSSITVKKGTKVVWTNKDSVTHTVVEADGQLGGPNSGDLAPGASYSFTFTQAGVFHYHCAIHTSMTGKVTVTE